MHKENQNIINELSKVGIKVNDIYDLVNCKHSYSNAIPVLINLLKKGIVSTKLKEGVIRALAVKEAKGKVGKILIEEFYKTPKEDIMLLWTIGNTMEVVISEDNIEDVIKIISNKKNGISRQMFVSALKNTNTEKVEEVLIKLLGDEQIKLHVLGALGKLKSQKAISKISKIVSNSKGIIRIEATKALKNIKK
jgi:HEAT repeat protein